MRGREASGRAAVWSVIVPEILITGELDYINVAGKTHLPWWVAEVELHSKSRSALRVFVDRQQRPAVIQPVHRVHTDHGP